MNREPLYRNQEELNMLFASTESVQRLVLDNYVRDERAREQDYELADRFYLGPAGQKVFGCDWRTYHLQKEYRRAQQSNWTLNLPQKKEDFSAWFDDETTGKPVIHPRQIPSEAEAQRRPSSRSAVRPKSNKTQAEGDSGKSGKN
jgi:hypothetical protein